MKLTPLAFVVGLIVLGCPDIAQAHDGATDANGCHVDSATGMSHCHDGIGSITPQQWLLIGVSVAALVAASAASIAVFAWMNAERDEEREAKFRKLYPDDDNGGDDWEDGDDWNQLLKRYNGMAVLVPLRE